MDLFGATNYEPRSGPTKPTGISQIHHGVKYLCNETLYKQVKLYYLTCSIAM